jgi:hypothetical protein
LFFFIVTTPAIAEDWDISEGVCNEWQGQWTMAGQGGGKYKGTIKQKNVGAPCTENYGAGGQLTGLVDAELKPNGSFHAWQKGMINNNNCTYKGQLVNKTINGTYTCGTNPTKYNFTLTLPPDDD